MTLGEISRNLEAARKDIAGVAEQVRGQPDWADVARVEKGLETKITALDTATATKNALQDLAIAKLEGWGNWATKLGGGAIIAAVLVSAGLK